MIPVNEQHDYFFHVHVKYQHPHTFASETAAQAAMKFLQLVALSQTFLVAEGSRRVNERIIGGKEMNSGRFPYAVALADDIGQFCGGSLIAEDVVLTAGKMELD